MNAKNIIKALTTYSNNVSDIEHMIVYAFIKKEKGYPCDLIYGDASWMMLYVSKP